MNCAPSVREFAGFQPPGNPWEPSFCAQVGYATYHQIAQICFIPWHHVEGAVDLISSRYTVIEDGDIRRAPTVTVGLRTSGAASSLAGRRRRGAVLMRYDNKGPEIPVSRLETLERAIDDRRIGDRRWPAPNREGFTFRS